MLRIDIQQGEKGTNLILAGKLMGPWVTELEKCWNAVRAAESCQAPSPIRVDLSEVTFIDERGKQLVAQMCQSGIKLAGTGLIAGFLCKEIEAEAHKCQPVDAACQDG